MAVLAPQLERRTGAMLGHLARALALFGGIVLAGIAAMTVLSVIGRALVSWGLGPVPGDFELVQIGCAIAVFSFLPWCQLNRGHVTVDLLVERFSPRVQAMFQLFGDIALGAVALVMARQLWAGMIEKFCADPNDPVFGWLWTLFGTAQSYCWVEATYELNLPVWWGYGIGMIGASLFAATAVFSIWRSLNEVLA